MTKNSALSALFELHPKLSDGRILNKNLLESVMDESTSAAEETVAGPFSQLEQALSGPSSPEDISRMLQEIAGKL